MIAEQRGNRYTAAVEARQTERNFQKKTQRDDILKPENRVDTVTDYCISLRNRLWNHYGWLRRCSIETNENRVGTWAS